MTVQEMYAQYLEAKAIPEPAPELCAFPGCATKEHDGRLVHTAHISPELAVTMCPCRGWRDHVDCHDFVAPQAKPLMSPAQQQIAEEVKAANQQAKPVLREPKPDADGYPDVCLECRGEKPGRNFTCAGCFSLLPIPDFNRLTAGWRASQAKPAAKDIPSKPQAAASTTVLPSGATSAEAARGGEAAITSSRETFQRLVQETGPSAVAAAPAIEPWRPSVDDWDLLPDASEGWRR